MRKFCSYPTDWHFKMFSRFAFDRFEYKEEIVNWHMIDAKFPANSRQLPFQRQFYNSHSSYHELNHAPKGISQARISRELIIRHKSNIYAEKHKGSFARLASSVNRWSIKLICVLKWICTKTVNLLIYAIAWEHSIFAIKFTVYFSFRQPSSKCSTVMNMYSHMHGGGKNSGVV